jgi:glycosyltransferase involved in cell wall biosynthesis
MRIMNRITVYTATYNRAYTLHKGYQSLCNQTCKDFEWLIVDDGSIDNTKELVQSWIDDKIIKIKYIYQENMGVNCARNIAIENINTELNICVDSDDYLTSNAIEKILDIWDSRKFDIYVGIIALDCYSSGKIVGKRFPLKLEEATLFELYEKYRIYGDKKMVYKTTFCKKYPTPSYDGEKYYPNRYKYYMIDKEGPSLLLNEPICVVEYLEDGITASRFYRYKANPIGLAEYRKFLIKYNPSLINVCRQSIHYIAMRLLSKRKIGIMSTNKPVVTCLMLPFGFMWYRYILYKVR